MDRLWNVELIFEIYSFSGIGLIRQITQYINTVSCCNTLLLYVILCNFWAQYRAFPANFSPFRQVWIGKSRYRSMRTIKTNLNSSLRISRFLGSKNKRPDNNCFWRSGIRQYIKCTHFNSSEWVNLNYMPLPDSSVLVSLRLIGVLFRAVSAS